MGFQPMSSNQVNGMKLNKLLSSALLAALFASAALAEDNWIKRNAELRTDPSAAGSTVAKVQKGDKVQVLEKSGAWVKVDLKGKTGWVSADSLSSREVKPDAHLTGALGTSAESSTGAAAKGLQEDTRVYAQNQHLSTHGIDEMIDIKKSITPAMLKDFVADGNINPPRKHHGPTAEQPPANP
jgi:hypothetical protein